MTTRAILAGSGALPGLLLSAGPSLLVRMHGIDITAPDTVPSLPARFEHLGALFDDLRAAGVTEICFAGAMKRTEFDPMILDDTTKALLPRIMQAQMQGDDALLRMVMAIFEDQGFTIIAACDIRPDLVIQAGVFHGQMTHHTDTARARAVLHSLSPHDVGQGCVVAKGHIIGIETLQGTDAMLRFVQTTAPGSGGVLVKRAKDGQDLRVDMPAIGPQTIAHAAAAGLKAIEAQQGKVLLLDPDAVRAACQTHDINLWAHE